MDTLFGSFSESPLSFCYSFLFLGIIYSRWVLLFLWFFFAQCLIAFFSGQLISPFIILLSPLLNLAFGIAMPLLFILALPLVQWQMNLGLQILKWLQKLVEISATVSSSVPSWEINAGVICCFIFLYLGFRKSLTVSLIVLSFSLNLDNARVPSFGNYEFIPQGRLMKIIPDESGETVYWSDGKCRRDLVRGIWWEKCSPRKGSTRKKS